MCASLVDDAVTVVVKRGAQIAAAASHVEVVALRARDRDPAQRDASRRRFLYDEGAGRLRAVSRPRAW